MKYNGKELVPITTTDVQNLPKRMLVWDTLSNTAEERVVIALVKDKFDKIYVIAQHNFTSGVTIWEYCAEIPSIRNATHRELAEWLAKGNGEVRTNEQYVYTHWNYCITDADKIITSLLFVKKFEDDDWHKPTVEYLDLVQNEDK